MARSVQAWRTPCPHLRPQPQARGLDQSPVSSQSTPHWKIALGRHSHFSEKELLHHASPLLWNMAVESLLTLYDFCWNLSSCL